MQEEIITPIPLNPFSDRQERSIRDYNYDSNAYLIVYFMSTITHAGKKP